MNFHRLFTALFLAVLASTPAAPPTAAQTAISAERLGRVYANLKNAQQMATGAVAIPDDELLTAAKAMSPPCRQ